MWCSQSVSLAAEHGPSSGTWGSYQDYEHEDESSELAGVPRLRFDDAGSEVNLLMPFSLLGQCLLGSEGSGITRALFLRQTHIFQSFKTAETLKFLFRNRE